MIRKQLFLFLIAGLALAMACGPADPDLEKEYPDEITGELTSVSPGTVRGDTPEPVQVDLRVDDRRMVKQLLEDGARFEISLRDSTGEEMISVDDIVEPDGDEDGVFELRFTPNQQQRRNIRKQLQVQLALDNGGKVYAWGQRHLAFPKDVGDIDLEQRQASRLEGLVDPEKVWSRDLDGDGIDDLVVLDSDGDSRRLVVFRCGDGKCSNEGEVALSTDGDIGGPYVEIFEIPDLVASPDDGDGTSDDAPFVIAYPSLLNATTGEVREVEHLVIRLAGDRDGVVVEEQRTQIALPSRDGRTWLAETMKPRLFQNPDSEELVAAISIINREESSGDVSLNHVLLQHAVEPISTPLHMVFEGLDDQGRQAALHGQISTCPIEELYQEGAEIPDGRLVSIFEHDGATMVGVGSLSSPDQMIAPKTLPEGLSRESVEGRHGRCKLVDLDGDGHRDLAFSISTDQGQALLVAVSDASSDGVAVGEPQLVMDGLSDTNWDLDRDQDDDLRLVLSRAPENPPTGEQPEITYEIGLEANVDDTGTVTVTVSNQKPTVSGIHVSDGDGSSSSSVVRATRGYDLVSIDHLAREPFADGISSADVGGLFLGSEQLISSGGMWVAAHFSGGLVEGDESALLQPGDPESIIGWLSTTGPFLPVTSICCTGKSTPVIIMALSAAIDDEDSDDDGVEAHIASLIVNDDGEATGLRLQDLAIIDGEPQIAGESELDLDLSSTALATKNVVKFKAGAELSKTAAAPDSDDCPDAEDGVCPVPSSTTLLFVMDSGELATAGLSAGGGMGKVSIQKFSRASGSDDGGSGSDAEEIFFDSLGEVPVLGERRPPLGVDVWESAASRYTETELSQGQGEDQQTLTRSESRILFGDFQGLGHPQILEMTLGEDDDQNELLCKSNHLSIGGGKGQGDLDSIEAALDRQIQSVCIPDDETIALVDIDGDRCQDLVFPESRRALLSRCDGTFEPELVELGNWSGHLGDDDGWVNKAQDYNSSRSNKPSTIRFDPDDDGDGIDDEVIIVCPFVDGLQRVR